MNVTSQNTALLTALHFTVDCLCASCVFMVADGLELFVLYNILAFLTQPLTGLMVDRAKHGYRYLSAGICLLLLGGLLSIVTEDWSLSILAYPAIVLVGLGNSLFHVFGGKSVAVSTGNDMRHLGIFVSSGALGLLVGGMCDSTLPLAAIMLILALLGITLYRCCPLQALTASPLAHIHIEKGGVESERAKAIGGDTMEGGARTALLAFMMLLVFFRSFSGQMIPQTGTLAIVAVLTVVLTFAGKSLGGFLGHRFGAWRTLCCSLLLAGACLLAGNLHAGFVLGMVLCVNLTMPLTLHLANRSLPGREGLAFGLLAATLLPGYALGNHCTEHELAQVLLFGLVATIIIEALVLLVLKERRWTVLAMSVVMNILTNVPLNLAVQTSPTLGETLPSQLGLEAIVLLVESGLYYLILRNMRKSFTYALLCNGISYLAGLLFTLMI